MRIVGGVLRGRPLAAPAAKDVRPTTDRVREALFNILAHASWADGVLEGAQVLDACCGTGALGLEALSRGAAECCFVDAEPDSLALARRNAASLGVEAQCRFVRADIANPPAPAVTAGLVLLDPPYKSDLAIAGLKGLTAAGWLAPGALVVAELPGKGRVPDFKGFEMLDTRRYGETGLAFLRLE